MVPLPTRGIPTIVEKEVSAGLHFDTALKKPRVKTGVVRAASIGQLEFTRADLQQAIDAKVYGEVTNKGFSKGCVEKLNAITTTSAGIASAGGLVALAAATGLVSGTPSIVGGAVLMVGTGIAVIADMARTQAIHDHAKMAERIQDPKESLVDLVRDVQRFNEQIPTIDTRAMQR